MSAMSPPHITHMREPRTMYRMRECIEPALRAPNGTDIPVIDIAGGGVHYSCAAVRNLHCAQLANDGYLHLGAAWLPS